MGSKLTLARNEIEYIIKAITSLENRGILLKGSTKNEEFFGNVLGPLMKVGLPLRKNASKPLA